MAIDLTPEEREALVNAFDRNPVDLLAHGFADGVAEVVRRALAAVPRLREVEGMGLVEEIWCVRDREGETTDDCVVSRAEATKQAEWWNEHVAPGHHAVRLAVVEVATPTEEQDDA